MLPSNPLKAVSIPASKEQLERDVRWTNRIQEEIKDLPVNIVVELASKVMKAKEVLTMQVGDVLLFDKKVADPLLGRVEGVPKFTCFAGQSHNAKAFKVKQMLYPQH